MLVIYSVPVISGPSCQQSATKREGYEERGRPRYGCRPCQRDFAANSTAAFSGSRWPAAVVRTAVRWSASSPLSAAQVMQLLAERPSEGSARPVLNWVHPFGPQLAKMRRRHRRRWGRRWDGDEGVCVRGEQQRYLCGMAWSRPRSSVLTTSRTPKRWPAPSPSLATSARDGPGL